MTATSISLARRRLPAGLPPISTLLGNFAVLVGLALVWAAFQALNGNFLSPRNLSNLVLQTAVLGTLAVGMVIVLILGEIDLSVGAIAGVSAGCLAIALTTFKLPALVAILIALAVGALIGLVHGTVIRALGIPSFIVTLAGLLVWQGVQLAIIGDGGEIAITDPFIQAVASTYLPRPWGWSFAAIAVAAALLARAARRRRRHRHGLAVTPAVREGAVWLLITAAALALTAVLNSYFGIPWVLVVLLALVVAMTVMLSDTPFGRHLYAIGGNREAARRAGVPVGRVVVTVFIIISAVSAAAGVLEASREFAATNALGGGTLQLNAIAAAVIGGTSLFGGRGRIYNAILGAVVVGSVQNGLDLLGQPAAVKSIATGIILIAAVAVDAVSRRRRLARGAAE